jgi:hypothetical protein
MFSRMVELLQLIWSVLTGLIRSRASREAEIAALRHQLNVLHRQSPKRPTFSALDRLIFVVLFHIAPGITNVLKIVEPETVIRWHRSGLRQFWRWKSRSRRGRPQVPSDIRQLIREMSLANPLWGAPVDYSARPKANAVVRRDRASHRGMDRPSAHRSLRLGRAADISYPRPGWRLWRRLSTASARDGHSRQANRPTLALAEWTLRTLDRLDPTRVP